MKQRYILLLAMLGLGAASCNYLDVKPTGQVIPETVSEYRAMLTTGYKFPGYKQLLAVRADEVFPYSNNSTYDEYISVALWDESNPGSYTDAYPWLSMYNTIFYANSVIAADMKAERNVGGDTEGQLKAEAYLLRAYTHFELLNLYAKPYSAATASTDRGVPLALRIDIEQDYVPATVEKVYDQILEDIRSGQELMQVEEQPVSTRYRFSKQSAKALEARVRLYRSEWSEALAAAQELLPCELKDLNDPSAVAQWYYNSKEAIQTLDWVNGRSNQLINGKLFTISNLMDKYNKDNDLRMKKYTFNSKGTWQPNGELKDKMIMTFRSAEIYLIAAESAAHIEGQLTVAKGYLKQLMEKRLTPDYYAERAALVDAMTQSELLSEIADERLRELALEGHRWFDLRRTTRPQITKVYTDKNNNEQTAILQANDARYTIRFPKEAIANNPSLND